MDKSKNQFNDNERSHFNYSHEINLVTYLRILKKYKKLIVIIVFSVTLLSIIVSLIWPKSYQAKAVIMPIGGGGGGLAAMAAQFSGLPFVSGMLENTKTSTSQFMALLKTRTLGEVIIKKFDLMKIFYNKLWDEKAQKWKIDDPKKVPNMEDAVMALNGRVKFADDKKMGVITITSEFKDPELAAKVANGFLDALQMLISKNSFSMAKRNRIFIEGQLTENKKELLEVGKSLNEFYKDGRVSNVESKVDVVLNSSNASNGNPLLISSDIIDNSSEVNISDNEISDLEKKLNEVKVAKGIPQQVYLQYLNLRRELLGKMNALLTQQFEMAKIDEAKEDLAFQVIDSARVPERRFKPKRKQMVVISFMASIFIAFFIAFFLDYIQRLRTHLRASKD